MGEKATEMIKKNVIVNENVKDEVHNKIVIKLYINN